jgi:hypothetical protein
VVASTSPIVTTGTFSRNVCLCSCPRASTSLHSTHPGKEALAYRQIMTLTPGMAFRRKLVADFQLLPIPNLNWRNRDVGNSRLLRQG